MCFANSRGSCVILVACDYTLQIVEVHVSTPCGMILKFDNVFYKLLEFMHFFSWHGLRLLVAISLDLDHGVGSLELCFLI